MNDGNKLGYGKLDMVLQWAIEHVELVDVAVFPFWASNPVCPTQQLTAHTRPRSIDTDTKETS